MTQNTALTSATIAIVAVLAAVLLRKSASSNLSALGSNNSTEWNLFYHLGGYGPYVPKVAGVASNTILPDGCRIEQVHMVSHGSEQAGESSLTQLCLH